MMYIFVHKEDIMALNICSLSFQNLDEGLGTRVGKWESLISKKASSHFQLCREMCKITVCLCIKPCYWSRTDSSTALASSPIASEKKCQICKEKEETFLWQFDLTTRTTTKESIWSNLRIKNVKLGFDGTSGAEQMRQ